MATPEGGCGGAVKTVLFAAAVFPAGEYKFFNRFVNSELDVNVLLGDDDPPMAVAPGPGGPVVLLPTAGWLVLLAAVWIEVGCGCGCAATAAGGPDGGATAAATGLATSSTSLSSSESFPIRISSTPPILNETPLDSSSLERERSACSVRASFENLVLRIIRSCDYFLLD